jgi:serine protease AprX
LGVVHTPSLKIGPSINLDTQRQQDVIVIMQDQAKLTGVDLLTTKTAKGRFVAGSLQKQARSQEPLVSFLKEKGLRFQRFYIANMVAVDSVSTELINELAAREDVRKIVANPSIRNIVRPVLTGVPDDDPDKTVGPGPNIVSTGATAVWDEQKTRGKGIVVAGQDTGVQWNHPALIRQYRGNQDGKVDHSYSWHDSIHSPISGGTNPCGYDINAPCDDDQHGTHTMGTMVGDDGGDNKIGMAPDAQWIACRNMDAGVGRPSTYIECFEWFLAPYVQGEDPATGDPTKAPNVINNSWGCPAEELCEGNEFAPVLEALYKAGIMVVVSAGNDGPSCSTIKDQPATQSRYTLSVGAHDHRSGKIASFSSRGPSTLDGQIGPDITAPGVSIRSSVPGDTYEGAMWSGTSMAGPHVVGAVALLWSAQPKLIGHIDETVAALTGTAIPATSTEVCGGVAGTAIPNNTYGFGLLDVKTAVAKALAPSQEQQKP